MDNLNADMLNNLKGMMGDKDLSNVLSNISPEMIEGFSKMMSNNSNNSDSSNNTNSNDNDNDSDKSSDNNSFNGFGNMDFSKLGNMDFSNLDMETILKLQSAFSGMNNKKDDPRSNLLYSLKPYLRKGRQENVDKYVNMLKLTNLSQLFKNNDKKENNQND